MKFFNLNGHMSPIAYGEVKTVYFYETDSDLGAKLSRHSINVKIFDTNHGVETLNDVTIAEPINTNIRLVPSQGDIVQLMYIPTKRSSGLKNDYKLVYTEVISMHNNVTENRMYDLPNVKIKGNGLSASSISNAAAGITSTNEERPDSSFAKQYDEKNTKSTLQSYEGDVINESRYGSSFRLSATQPFSSVKEQKPTWQIGSSVTGDPIMIIRQRKDLKRKTMRWVEDIMEDDSSIYISSGQLIGLDLADVGIDNLKAAKRLGTDRFSKGFKDVQILIKSGRVTLCSTDDEISMFSREGFCFATPENFTIDLNRTFEIHTDYRIHLGYDANNPIAKGNEVVNTLKNIIDIMQQMATAMTSAAAVMGGPVPSLNAVGGSTSSALSTLKAKLDKIKSKLAYVSK